MFRKEAIEHHKNARWNGKVLLFSPIPGWIYFVISFSLVIILTLYLVFGSYTRRINVSGELILLPHPIVISSSKSGYISDVFISVNSRVMKDQPLFKIKFDRVVDSGDVGLNSKKLIQSQIEQNNKIIINLNERKNIAMNNIQSRIFKNQEILDDIMTNSKELKGNIAEIENLVLSYKKLQSKGMASKNEVIPLQINLFEQKSIYQNLYSKLINQQIILSDLESERQAQEKQFNMEILKYNIQNNELQVKLMETEAVTEFIVKSSANGIIESMNVTLGQTINENTVLAKILPAEKKEYNLVLWVPHSAIAYIELEQPIKIRYESFPYEKFGQFDGVIKSISNIPASAQELSFYKNSQINPDPKNPLYKVIVETNKNYVTYDSKILFFSDGMRAEATLFLDKRPLYQWMLLPLYSLQKNIQ